VVKLHLAKQYKILINTPLASKAGQKNDLSIAQMDLTNPQNRPTHTLPVPYNNRRNNQILEWKIPKTELPKKSISPVPYQKVTQYMK